MWCGERIFLCWCVHAAQTHRHARTHTRCVHTGAGVCIFFPIFLFVLSAVLVSVFFLCWCWCFVFVLVRACCANIHTHTTTRRVYTGAGECICACVRGAYFFSFFCLFWCECGAGKRILFVLVLVFCFVLFCYWCVYECCAGECICCAGACMLTPPPP